MRRRRIMHQEGDEEYEHDEDEDYDDDDEDDGDDDDAFRSCCFSCPLSAGVRTIMDQFPRSDVEVEGCEP